MTRASLVYELRTAVGALDRAREALDRASKIGDVLDRDAAERLRDRAAEVLSASRTLLAAHEFTPKRLA